MISVIKSTINIISDETNRLNFIRSRESTNGQIEWFSEKNVDVEKMKSL